MKVTIDINEAKVESYLSIAAFLEEHPDRKDWMPIKAKMEREIAELVMDKIKQPC